MDVLMIGIQIFQRAAFNFQEAGAEKAEMKKAEAAFMEKEMKLLQQRFEAEKEKIHAQFVAEGKALYSASAE